MSKDALIYPVFVKQGANVAEPIQAMEGQRRYSVDRLAEVFDEMLESGVRTALFFGLPESKDPEGSEAYREDGIVQTALRYTAEQYPEIYRISDVCLCGYTSHGHCGILKNGRIDNDGTLEKLALTALSQAKAGAQIVAPSDMMDGRVRAIRNVLDGEGYETLPLMSYAVKYASAFYRPFREAADCAPAFGDRKTYQMDYHNGKESLKEALGDIEEGADLLLVKPALPYLDVIQKVSGTAPVPVGAYSVSGEYAMIKAAAKAGFLDEASVVCETATAVFRAGGSFLISYFAKEIARWIQGGRIG
jgi:porphobilinogen synthase